MDNFEQDVAEARVDTYLVRFADHKDKVAQTYPQLDMSKISAIEVIPKEKEEEGLAKEEAARTEGAVVEEQLQLRASKIRSQLLK